jgi:hypothetical protein
VDTLALVVLALLVWIIGVALILSLCIMAGEIDEVDERSWAASGRTDTASLPDDPAAASTPAGSDPIPVVHAYLDTAVPRRNRPTEDYQASHSAERTSRSH